MTWDSGHILMLTCKRIKMVDINLWRQLQGLTEFSDIPQMWMWVVSDLSNGYIKYSNVIYQNKANSHRKCVAEPDFLIFLVFFSYRGPKVDP